MLLALLVLVFLFECKIVNNEGGQEGKNTEAVWFNYLHVWQLAYALLCCPVAGHCLRSV